MLGHPPLPGTFCRQMLTHVWLAGGSCWSLCWLEAHELVLYVHRRRDEGLWSFFSFPGRLMSSRTLIFHEPSRRVPGGAPAGLNTLVVTASLSSAAYVRSRRHARRGHCRLHGDMEGRKSQWPSRPSILPHTNAARVTLGWGGCSNWACWKWERFAPSFSLGC